MKVIQPLTERLPAAVVGVEMGYGHLRAAMPLADALGVEMLQADQPPFAGPEELRLWAWVRRAHEVLSKYSQVGGFAGVLEYLLDRVTMIPPLHEDREPWQPGLVVKWLEHLMARGLGRGLVEHLRSTRAPLLTTFYAPALVADRAGIPDVYCVVTDADIHRVWVSSTPQHSEIRYLAPSPRVVRRLTAYGVRPEYVRMTGFPLPLELVGTRENETLRHDLARRLVRLDPGRTFREIHRFELERLLGVLPKECEGEPPLVTLAVGGAGAQTELAAALIGGLRRPLASRALRLCLVAGLRSEVKRSFEDALEREGLGSFLGSQIEILHEASFEAYYRSFNRVLRRTDVLWTKPSELVFYAALGIPIVLAKPVGAHERFNRQWLRDQGIGLKQRHPRHAYSWLLEWLNDGTLAAAAWSGYVRLPKDGTHEIVERLRNW